MIKKTYEELEQDNTTLRLKLLEARANECTVLCRETEEDLKAFQEENERLEKIIWKLEMALSIVAQREVLQEAEQQRLRNELQMFVAER